MTYIIVNHDTGSPRYWDGGMWRMSPSRALSFPSEAAANEYATGFAGANFGTSWSVVTVADI